MGYGRQPDSEGAWLFWGLILLPPYLVGWVGYPDLMVMAHMIAFVVLLVVALSAGPGYPTREQQEQKRKLRNKEAEERKNHVQPE